MKKNILEYLEYTAAVLPDKTAFSSGEEDLSFGELFRASRAIGTGLLSSGLCREAVIVFMDKHPSTMAAFFGVIYAGCYYACVDASMPDERIRSIISSLGARAVISDTRSKKRAESLGLEYF